MSDLSFGLTYAQGDIAIVLGSIGSMMHTSVTVWTEASHVSRIVRTAIAQAANVVGLQIRHTRCREEWRFAAATLASPSCPRQDILANSRGSLIDPSQGCRRILWTSYCSRFKGSSTKISERNLHGGLSCDRGRLQIRCECRRRHELEDESPTRSAFSIGSIFERVSRTSELIDESILATSDRLEKQQ